MTNKLKKERFYELCEELERRETQGRCPTDDQLDVYFHGIMDFLQEQNQDGLPLELELLLTTMFQSWYSGDFGSGGKSSFCSGALWAGTKMIDLHLNQRENTETNVQSYVDPFKKYYQENIFSTSSLFVTTSKHEQTPCKQKREAIQTLANESFDKRDSETFATDRSKSSVKKNRLTNLY